MISDPSTLLQTTAGVCVIAALAFWAGARFLAMSPRAANCWALANLAFAAGTALTVLRAGWPSPWLYTLADTLELLGYACLHGGLQIFLRRRWAKAEPALVVGAAALLMGAAYATQQPVPRLIVYCGAAAWLLARTGQTAWRGGGAEFGRGVGALIATPMFVAALLQLLRGSAGSLSSQPASIDSLHANSLNLGLNWAAFALSLTLNFAIAGLVLVRLLARIRDLTLIDPLTGAMNRRALEQLLEQQLVEQRRHGQPLAVIYFDLDHFKTLNDRLGHAAGDAALCHVVAMVHAQGRTIDRLGRPGGEEFCVVLPYTALHGACLGAERLRLALEQSPLLWEGTPIAITASFGVAAAEAAQALTAADLLGQADRAMYEAKAMGRNCVAAAAP